MMISHLLFNMSLFISICNEKSFISSIHFVSLKNEHDANNPLLIKIINKKQALMKISVIMMFGAEFQV